MIHPVLRLNRGLIYCQSLIIVLLIAYVLFFSFFKTYLIEYFYDPRMPYIYTAEAYHLKYLVRLSYLIFKF